MQDKANQHQKKHPKITKIGLALVCIIGLFLWSQIGVHSQPITQIEYSGVTSHVIDGDTLRMRGREQSIRLWGVDAPENDEKGFQRAKNRLFSLAQNKPLRCLQIDIDKYDRSVARCFLLDGAEINLLMIQSGTAKEYKFFSKGFYSRLQAGGRGQEK